LRYSEGIREPRDILAEDKQRTSDTCVNILVYPLPIRIFHWVLVFSLSLTIISGIIISFTYPLLTMRTVRFIHVSMGFIVLAITLYRLGYGFLSGDYKNFSIKLEDFKTFPELVKYYLFLREDPPPLRTKYNIGQKFTMFSWLMGVFYLAFAGIMLLNASFVSKGPAFFPLARFILPQQIRVTKFFLTIYFIITIILHIYLAHTEDIAKTQSMFTGWVRVLRKK
jgi:Ni/Fe-hydrogenase 1 B-type cytochrome subunit